MAEDSKIEWTDHTFNPWRGCTKVSPGCTNCYAEKNMSVKLHGVKWGPNGNRVVASESYWRQPIKWNMMALTMKVWCKGEERQPHRPRVFCASLADIFEDWHGRMTDAQGRVLYWDQDDKTLCATETENDGEYRNTATMDDFRRRLFSLIDATPNLDWLLLTKRPENVLRMMPDFYPPRPNGGPSMNIKGPRPNLWIGVSVEDQQRADVRIPLLLQVPAVVRFLSCEPLLGPLQLQRIAVPRDNGLYNLDPLRAQWHGTITRDILPGAFNGAKIGWVIVGGESGSASRPCRPEWVRSIVKQCKAARVPVFVKQMGAYVVTRNDMIEDGFNNLEVGWPDPEVEHDIHGFREEYQGADCRVRLRDKKGGTPEEWPADLRVREFPNVNLHTTVI